MPLYFYSITQGFQKIKSNSSRTQEFSFISIDFVAEYCRKIGYQKSAEEYIRQNNNFVVNHNGREEMSGAAILLFSKNPQRFFKRARIRFIRYDGIEAKVRTEMNVIKDEMFEGRILDIVRSFLDFVRSQIKEHTRLGADGLFHTTPEYPEFAWKEIIINSIAHRDYSIRGTDIQIKMFDDRITVESPGILPGIVRLKAGLPAPEYRDNAFMLNATILNGVINETDRVINEVINGAINISATERAVLVAIKKKTKITKVELQKETSLGKSTIDRQLKH